MVHVPDPLWPTDVLVEALPRLLGPAYRVLSLTPRAAQPYQVQASDVSGLLDQFGFSEPVLVGERVGAVAALLVAAWFSGLVSKLVLVDAAYGAPPGSNDQRIETRALRDCPPDGAALRSAVPCPVLQLRWSEAAQKDLVEFLRLP